MRVCKGSRPELQTAAHGHIPMHARSRSFNVATPLTVLALVLLVAADVHAASAAALRHELQMQQQQDALTLRLQQSIRARRYDLGPGDERRLDQLQMQQRLEQQLLEQQQLQREHLLTRDGRTPPSVLLDARTLAQREQFSQERQSQLQRFEVDQQRLLNSARALPLQPPLSDGTLSFP